MRECPKCKAQIEDGAKFCPSCGYSFSGVVANPYDRTAEFDAKDISENKVIAMLIYLMGAIGIVVALLASGQSAYVRFHLRQGLKFIVVETLLGIIMGLLCWTFIVPIAGAVCMVIITVLRFISFFQICAGKAVEPAIVRSLGFLK